MFERGLTYEKTITMVTEQCCNCGVVFGMPSDLNESFRNDSSKWFYCPNGHHQHYTKSTATLLKEKFERELLQKDNQIANLSFENSHIDTQLKKATRQLKRVEKGVCPCCNRTFIDLQRHMKSKHPDHKI